VPDRSSVWLCSVVIGFFFVYSAFQGVPWLVNAKAVGLEVSKELNEVFEG